VTVSFGTRELDTMKDTRVDIDIGINHRVGSASKFNKKSSVPILNWGRQSRGDRRCGEGKDSELDVRAHVRKH
jgi:hypothetical protein